MGLHSCKSSTIREERQVTPKSKGGVHEGLMGLSVSPSHSLKTPARSWRVCWSVRAMRLLGELSVSAAKLFKGDL